MAKEPYYGAKAFGTQHAHLCHRVDAGKGSSASRRFACFPRALKQVPIH